MIAQLFNAPIGETEVAVGVGTVGSSEAIMLAGLAFKRKWQMKRKLEGKPCDKPNIVTGANVQVGFTLALGLCATVIIQMQSLLMLLSRVTYILLVQSYLCHECKMSFRWCGVVQIL